MSERDATSLPALDQAVREVTTPTERRWALYARTTMRFGFDGRLESFTKRPEITDGMTARIRSRYREIVERKNG